MSVLLWNPGRQTNGGSNSVVFVVAVVLVVRAQRCAGGRNSGSTAPRTAQTAKKKTRTKKHSHQQDDTFLRRNGLLPETDFLSRSALVLLLWTFRAAIVSWNVLFQRSTNQHLFFINHGGKASYFSPVQSLVTIVPPWVNRPPTLVPWAQNTVLCGYLVFKITGWTGS